MSFRLKPWKTVKVIVVNKPLIMDGAMGTELMARGLKLPLPLWSAEENLTDLETVLAVNQVMYSMGELKLLKSNPVGLFLMILAPIFLTFKSQHNQSLFELVAVPIDQGGRDDA